ncbi:MAG: nucleotidyl transferase AbiEii/AbiGii toxin family protein [Candidatus Vogelbacteria bacterium]
MDWRLDILPSKTRKALDYLGTESWLANDGWYLAGGTALALQAGHRQSVDLDFFTPKKTFVPAEVVAHFSEDIWEADIVKDGTIYGIILGAKVSFIAYPFFAPMVPKLKYHRVEVLDKDDIAVMKIIAVSQRGRKRDFFDLFWYVKNVAPLISVIKKLPQQYPTVAHDFHHIIKSLTYFADAENDPMPQIFFQATWVEVKKFFQTETKKIAQELLGLT